MQVIAREKHGIVNNLTLLLIKKVYFTGFLKYQWE